AQPTFYLDDITLVGSGAPLVTNAALVITVDAQLNRHPISPLIYGVAFASASQLADLNAPLNRSGGNAETRYNWQLNAHNRGGDWYFESLADSSATPGAAADDFVASSKSAGAEPMLTIPLIGWAPKLGPNRSRLASYSIAKYGSQTDSDVNWFQDAGNGVSITNNTSITWNDPNDANLPTDVSFQQGFVQHLTNRWGLSTNGGVRYYFLDNEHSLWHSTHRDVHPLGASMREIRDKSFEYAAKIKALDPAALVLGPEEWGWSGYFYSGYDQQYGSQHGWGFLPDRSTNGGWDYLPWLLDQFRQRAATTNQRLLDYFTVHFYPQSGEFNEDYTTTTQLLRNRSTRALWDTNYIDTSWINTTVKLIPRLKSWVATYYPGTRIGITEYNWGAENHINGATAQADIYGIFGREGLDLATRWTTPASSTPIYKAMKLYRNYDGNKSGFGDISVNAAGSNPDTVAAFAAARSGDGALTIMVINKQLAASATASLGLTNFFPAGTAQVWQLTAANAITRLADVSFTGKSFTNTVPAQSITLYVVAAGTPPPAPRLRPGVANVGGNFELWLEGQAGSRYIIHASTNFADWIPVQTNTLSSNSVRLLLPGIGGPQRFYRAQWVP
ncbi:MAG TPA: glycoside hydrolase family 44 protein, partial [Bacillota bacterium]|nr:glycoside hydrolase family 44 protein [Bacillota bacterium]